MNIYMTEEEQIEQIKKWRKNYGNMVMSAILVIVLAITGWRWWQNNHAAVLTQTSQIYQQLLNSVEADQTTDIQAQANTLISEHPKTAYANMAALILAREYVKQNQLDKAIAQLDNVIKQSKQPTLRQVARIRKARLWLAQKKYQNALTLLETIDAKVYMPLILEVRGDIYLAQGKQSKQPTLRQVARIRKARLWLAQKKYQSALTLLEPIDDKVYMPLISEVRGDIYLAQGKQSQARKSYTLALQALPRGAQTNPLLQMKLSELPNENIKVN